MYDTTLKSFEFSVIVLNSAEETVTRSDLLMRKYLCIPMKYPAILISFPLNNPMFLLWNSYYFDLNIEWGLWYIPEPKKLYIAFWAEIIWFTTGILETSLKNKETVCSTPRMTVVFGWWIFKIHQQSEHLKLHQTWSHQ